MTPETAGPGELDANAKLAADLDQNAPFLILVDGHNVAHNLEHLFADVVEDGVPGRRAREKLLDLVAELVRGKDRGQARIYFDGPQFTEKRHGPDANVLELFSGGQGVDRADRAILDHLRTLADKPQNDQLQGHTILVSNDQELQSQAAQLGATRMSLFQFESLLVARGVLDRFALSKSGD